MVGKIIVEGFPKITVYYLGTNLDDVRFQLSDIDFSVPGVHILKLQPGTGKTFRIKEFLREQENFLVITASHKLIFEEYEGRGAKHWQNFTEKCEIYDKVKKLHSHGVSIRMICSLNHCDKRKCGYWKQFQTKKAVAPLHFLPTDRVQYRKGENKGDFKFDLLIVDESMKEFNTIEYDQEETKDSINTIEKYYDVEEQFKEFVDYLDGDDFPSISEAHNIYKLRNMALKRAIEDKNWSDIEKIAKFNSYNLRQYIYYHNIYEDILSYPEPFFYHVLDLALEGIPVIFLDATFDEETFVVLLGRYLYENDIIPRHTLINKSLDSIDNLEINFYESQLQSKDIIIHRMDKDNFYYKWKGFFNKSKEKNLVISENGKKTINELRNLIIKAKRKHTHVGIITYSDLEHYFNDLGETDYFFNLKGSNKLENIEALFIIGTPQPGSDIVQEYNNLCLTDIDPGNTYRMTHKKTKGGFYRVKKENGKIVRKQQKGFNPYKEKKSLNLTIEGYNDFDNDLKFNEQLAAGLIDANVFYPLSSFDYNMTESEKYQAIHRARLFREEGLIPEIYVFGDVPEKIKEEFTVEVLDKKQTQTYFNGGTLSPGQFNGAYPLPLYNSIIDIKYKNNSLKSQDIAKKLKLYKDRNKKSGYNTTFVTKIINGEVSIEQMSIIHDYLKKGRHDKELIKKHSKVDEKFIKDCMIYAYKGDYIQLET